MRTMATMMVLILLTSMTAGCTAEDCEKTWEVDNSSGQWDEGFFYVAKMAAGATGHFEIVGLIEIWEGVITFCAGLECSTGNVDACVELSVDFTPNETTRMLIGISSESYSLHQEITTDDLEEYQEIDWGEWTSNKYAFY